MNLLGMWLHSESIREATVGNGTKGYEANCKTSLAELSSEFESESSPKIDGVRLCRKLASEKLAAASAANTVAEPSLLLVKLESLVCSSGVSAYRDWIASFTPS